MLVSKNWVRIVDRVESKKKQNISYIHILKDYDFYEVYWNLSLI